jgi:cell division protein FtsL
VPVQVVVSANSPLTAMLVMVNAVVVLVFFSVVVCAALVVPMGSAAKESVEGLSVTV